MEECSEVTLLLFPQLINVTTFLWKTYPLSPSVQPPPLFFPLSCPSNPGVNGHFAQCTWPWALILKPTEFTWSLMNQVSLASGWKSRFFLRHKTQAEMMSSGKPTNMDSRFAEAKLYHTKKLFRTTFTCRNADCSVPGSLLKIRSQLQLMNSRFRLTWLSRSFPRWLPFQPKQPVGIKLFDSQDLLTPSETIWHF